MSETWEDPDAAWRPDEGVDVKERTEKPKLYKVLLHNDDYTTQEFVVSVLMEFFGKPRPEATRIMLAVHHQGIGVGGVFTYDVAQTKVARVTQAARAHGMPLLTTMEAE